MHNHRFKLILILILLLASPAWAVTRYVCNDATACNAGAGDGWSTGHDTNNDGLAKATPYLTIQKAADVVNAGDIVIVGDGTYTTAGSALVSLSRGGSSGNAVTFKAENKWGAKLDGQNNATGTGWLLNAGSSFTNIEEFEIYGFTLGIGNGNGVDVSYIGIYRNNIHDIGKRCTSYAYGQPAIYSGTLSTYWAIDRNIVHDNGRYDVGVGGCTSEVCNTDLDRCGVLDQALYLNGSYTDVTNNVFYNNNAGMDVSIKAAYGLTSGQHYNISNNTFGQSTYRFEGRLDLTAVSDGQTGSIDDILIQNNLFLSNRTWAIMCWSDANYCGSTTRIKNVTVRNNMTNYEKLIWNYVGNPYANITTANNSPELGVGESAFVADITNYNFHLIPTSPAYQAGILTNAPTLDYDGVTRNSGDGKVDIGAYEYTAAATWTVTASAGANGALSCNSPVNDGATTTCTATPDGGGYTTTSIAGCGGTWTTGNNYTTGAITANCVVTSTYATPGTPTTGKRSAAGLVGW